MSRDYTAYDPANDPLAIPRNEKRVQHILNTVSDETEQVDAICEARGWSRIDKNGRGTLNAYLAGTMSVSDTVSRMAVPIDSAYTSADHGRAFWDAEHTARGVRQAYGPEEAEIAEQDWGRPVAMCEPGPLPAGQFTTEGELWGLYFSIIHASRKTTWRGQGTQMLKLVELVKALKSHSDPPQPENMTPALRNDWIWKSGKLWSNLVMLGPSARESWNDHPGGTMGFTLPEVRAWENENAFVAHLTAEGIADFMTYGIWAMRDALEGGIARDQQMRNTEEMKARRIEVTLGVIVVWLHIAGEAMYGRACQEQPATESLTTLSKDIDASWERSTELSVRRWRFWKARLQTIADANMEGMSSSHAALALRLMRRINAIE